MTKCMGGERMKYLGLMAVMMGMGMPGCLPDKAASRSAIVPRFESVAAGADFPVAVPAAYRSTVGYLVVEENRERPTGREVRLPVAIVHAKRGVAEASPVLFLSGGPGIGSLNPAAYPGAYPWTNDRDFVVLGQRGTAHAMPPLTCPEYDVALQRTSFPDPEIERTRRLSVAAVECRERLVQAGVDPSAYHTAATVRDIEDLRRLLGIDQWTLFGISYGTRVALAVVRDYPASVRAMVLDSPLPPHVRYDDESASNFEASLLAVLQDCASQPLCAAAYPDLRSRFYSSVEAAAGLPVEVRGSRINGARLARLVDLTSPNGVAAAPSVMDAIARRDTAAIAELVGVVNDPTPFAWGVRLSVWCSEALPFSRRAVNGPRIDVLGGLDSAVIDPSVCESWAVPKRPASEVAAVVSDVPALILAGEFDPDTPPRWGHSASQTLSRSLVVTVRGGSHVPTLRWGGDGCAMEIAASFVADPMVTMNEVSREDRFCVFSGAGPSYVVPDDSSSR